MPRDPRGATHGARLDPRSVCDGEVPTALGSQAALPRRHVASSNGEVPMVRLYFGTFGEGHREQRERPSARRCLRGRRSRRMTTGGRLGRVWTARGGTERCAGSSISKKIGQILTTSWLRVVAFGRSVTRAALMMPAPRAWVREATPSQKRSADAASSVDSTGSKSTPTRQLDSAITRCALG